MSKRGLSEQEAIEIRKRIGENVLPSKEGPSWLSIFLDQFKMPLVYVLLGAAFISFIFKEYTDVSLVAVVVLLDVLMGFYQEYSAHKTLTALRKILKPKTLVIRDGERKEVETRELIPGDLVILGAGDRIPADGRVIEGINLLVQEAILTGEEEAVPKSIASPNNLVFMGTIVMSGRGIIEVLKIGSQTEIGKIGESVIEIKKEKTIFQIKLQQFEKDLLYIVLLICAFVFLLGVINQRDLWEMLRMAVVLSVAAIPEGLPIAITMISVLGMRRIFKRHGLVKRLMSIEALGATSVICTDKTGTLTEGIMRVVRTNFLDREKAILAMIFANGRRSNLEICLWEYAKKEALFDPNESFDSAKRVYEEPFDNIKKYALVVTAVKKKPSAFLMGAPEIVLSFCEIPKIETEKISTQIEKWADEGLKILGMAYKEKGDLKEKRGFLWLGLVGIEDPIRREAKEALFEAQQAGINVKIVTGDYRKTAERVATNLGFDLKPENVLEGKELDGIGDEDLINRIEEISLFTRVTPHQKLRIIKALQGNEEIVAMTGDGVNDAPALKMADVGVAMGTASDVAKEASDLILLDNNFKTIVAACEEGRLVFSNIKKVVGYVLSDSFAEIVLIFGAILLNLPSPLTIVQILWIHLICDGPIDILLGFEPKEKDLMRQKPKKLAEEEILDRRTKFLIFAISFTVGILVLFTFFYFHKNTGNLQLAQTIAFATIGAVDLIYVLAFKNMKRLIIQTENFFQNKYLFLGIVQGFLLVFAAIYVPILNRILGTVPLKPSHWLPILGTALVCTLWVEIVKLVRFVRGKQDPR